MEVTRGLADQVPDTKRPTQWTNVFPPANLTVGVVRVGPGVVGGVPITRCQGGEVEEEEEGEETTGGEEMRGGEQQMMMRHCWTMEIEVQEATTGSPGGTLTPVTPPARTTTPAGIPG
uniref:Uncharacterized protein n=1 Tax=Cacopsylla melanoneura TaxID=428564 RepID=A0A8D9EGU6_9HEMI